MNNWLYILGDADQVREGIDRHLLRDQLEELQRFSVSLTSGIADLAHAFEIEMSAEIFMVGGDDVLFRVAKEKYSRDAHAKIISRFYEHTGCTISFGVASNLSTAYINLRRAKAEKTGICTEEGSN